MPLLEMSPNVQEAEGARKRSHDEYADEVPVKVNGDGAANPPNPVLSRLGIGRDSPDESLACLTDGTATPPRASPSPNQGQPAPPATTDSPQTASQKNDQPAAKRKRLTAAEKAAKADEDARKKKEREEARQQKLAEKARVEKEKAAAKAARQAEKARKEEAEQEAKAAKQQERDEKRKKKEEEERRAVEEKQKKERSQLRLQSFFKKPSTPKKAAAAAAPPPAPGNEADASPSVTGSAKKQRTQYERMFQPFFVKEYVRVARSRPWLDDEAAEAKARILDEYVGGERPAADVVPFRPLEALQVAARPRREGRAHPPVRGIMERLQKSPSALAELRRIPTKLICFRQDVRPPYCGTLTAVPHRLGPGALARAARRPAGRVLELLYDYDSEGEWQDDEPGDDLDDMDDDEEDLDDEDDMDGFLDDSEDAGVARRIFANSMEPVATGPCWEGGEVNPELKPYRMEVILESISPEAGIDPFSKSYWSPPRKPKMAPPPARNNAFDALKPNEAAAAAKAPQITRPELIPEFKRAVLANQKLSKMAIVEVLGLQFEGLSKAETRGMLEHVAEKGGRGKVWELREGV